MSLSETPVTVGVLSLQGDVVEHLKAVRACGAEARAVLTATDLEAVDGLIIPGGESTTVGKLLARFGLLEPLTRRVRAGMPIYGTCTGLILLARHVEDGLPDQPVLATMDIRVRRNAFGRQRESFETLIPLEAIHPTPFRAVFIRAPEVLECGSGVEVLGRLEGRVVAVREQNMLATAFHPELTDDPAVHRYFVDMVRAARGKASAQPPVHDAAAVPAAVIPGGEAG